MPKKGKKGSKSDLEKEFEEYMPMEGVKKESKKWGIFEIQHFDFPQEFGGIAEYEVKSQEEARALAIIILKNDNHCMSYLPGLGTAFHKDIDNCEKV